MNGPENSHTREEKSEAIDIIFEKNEEEKLNNVTEEQHISDDDNPDLSNNAGSTEKIAKHVCGKCHKTFRTIRSFENHIDFCRFNSNYHVRKAEMLKNLDKIEKDANVMENTNVCFCCGESYDTYHFGQIKCSDCSKSFKTQLSYERHIFITHAEFDDHSCSICNAKLRSANLLKLHEDQHRNRSKPFACELCGKQFTRTSHLTSHQRYSSCSGNAVIECKFCNKSFERLGKLREHLKRQLCSQTPKESENMCPVCKKCFQNSHNLKVHSRIHTDERPFDCDLCTKKFRALWALQHHRRSHTGERPYTCSVCKESFVGKEVLNRHMKRHTGERPHVCSECGKGFIRSWQLRSHTKLHIKPYGCDKCNKKFGTKKKLESHVNKLHNKCKRCKIRFKTALEVNNHMKENVDCAIAERRKRKSRTNKHNFDSVLSSHNSNQRDTEIFVNENPSKNCVNSLPKVIKIQGSQGESFVTTSSKGGNILNTNIEDLKQQDVLETGDSETLTNNNVGILDQGYPVVAKSTIFQSNEEAITVISLESDDDMVEQMNTKTLPNSKGKILNTNIEELKQQHVLETGENDQGYTHTSAVVAKSTSFQSNEESITVISLDSDDDMVEQINTKTLPTIINTESKIKKSTTLAAAIADDKILETEVEPTHSKEDLKLKYNVRKLLGKLVDSATLKRFGWPNITEDIILCKLIENCGYDLTKEQHKFSGLDYATRMRKYVKLFLIVVTQSKSREDILNNDVIDEVIKYSLDNENDDGDIPKIVDRKKGI